MVGTYGNKLRVMWLEAEDSNDVLTSRYRERVTCGHGSDVSWSPHRMRLAFQTSGCRCGQEFAAARPT